MRGEGIPGRWRPPRGRSRVTLRNTGLRRGRGWDNRWVIDSLPVLDLSQLDAGPDAAESFRAELRRVTHEVGFFYLVGHGVDSALIDEALAVSRRFFDLPEADKLA